MKRSGQMRQDDELPRPDESFLARFHRRKLEAKQERVPTTIEDEPSPDTETPGELPTDGDMPALDTLDATSDYTGFLSPKVSEKLRRAALRKLFHSAQFNVVDGLDEYAEDYTTFESLGDIVTADMRHLIEVEARKKAEAIEKSLDELSAEQAESSNDELPENDEAPIDPAPNLIERNTPNPIDNSTETHQHNDIKRPTDT